MLDAQTTITLYCLDIKIVLGDCFHRTSWQATKSLQSLTKLLTQHTVNTRHFAIDRHAVK